MSETVFSKFSTVKFAGTQSTDPLTYRFYEADRVVLGKPLSEHLRFAIAWWHSLAMTGSDPFGSATINRSWMLESDPMKGARMKAPHASIAWSDLRESTLRPGFAPGRKFNGTTNWPTLICWENGSALRRRCQSCGSCSAKPKQHSIATS